MRSSQARIKPVERSEYDDALRALLDPLGEPLPNVVATLARAPEAARAFLEWGSYILSNQLSIGAREREIVILRIGYLCRSGYEFAQHKQIALKAGLSEIEIANIKAGAAAGWPAAEAVLIEASDDIVRDKFVSDPVWGKLRDHYSERQVMDIIFAASQYVQVSILLNSFGVQIDPGLEVDADLTELEHQA